jgi:hypothetical protein
MKTRLSIIVAGIMMIFLAGCIASIHPLYTSKDVVFEESLVGEWFEKNNSNRWVFESSGDSAYILTYYENGVFGGDSISTLSKFETILLKLKNQYFLDLYPGDNDHIPLSSLLSTTLFPVHTFAKLTFTDGEFVVSFFSNEWLQQSISENKLKIAHERANSQIILTASTTDLQEMVIKNADNTEAFIEPKTLVRSKN